MAVVGVDCDCVAVWTVSPFIVVVSPVAIETDVGGVSDFVVAESAFSPYASDCVTIAVCVDSSGVESAGDVACVSIATVPVSAGSDPVSCVVGVTHCAVCEVVDLVIGDVSVVSVAVVCDAVTLDVICTELFRDVDVVSGGTLSCLFDVETAVFVCVMILGVAEAVEEVKFMIVPAVDVVDEFCEAE